MYAEHDAYPSKRPKKSSSHEQQQVGADVLDSRYNPVNPIADEASLIALAMTRWRGAGRRKCWSEGC